MIEVLKQMYQLLLTEPHAPAVCDQLERIAREAIAELESQEPVAWIHNFIEGGISIGKRPSDLDRHPDRWTALYKEPKPCPTCEALCRTVMLDQTSHDTHPPQRTEPIQSLQCFHCQVTIETLNDKVMHLMAQRTWVGLTDEEFEQLLVDAKFTRSDLLMIGACVEDICNMVEAKLKEKNCL